jgi:hypothetical protein
MVQGRRHQTRRDPVQLRAGIAQTGHLDRGLITQEQPRPHRQPEQIDTAGGDILAHLSGRDGKSRVA